MRSLTGFYERHVSCSKRKANMTERTFSVQFRVGRALASFYVTAPDYEMAYEIGQSTAESQFPHCEIAMISAQEEV